MSTTPTTSPITETPADNDAGPPPWLNPSALHGLKPEIKVAQPPWVTFAAIRPVDAPPPSAL